MKKISLILIAVLCMAFISCNNNTDSVNPDPETVTPNELLRNLPVTTADFAELLKEGNASRVADPSPVNLAEQDSVVIRNNKISSTSEIFLLIMKFCISQTENFEFGKNTRIGVIGDAFASAKKDFLKVYPPEDVDMYLNSFATRDFGTIRVDFDDTKAVIFWHLGSWSDSGTTFPDCYLYVTGTYKNGKYENLSVYGEGYCYRYKADYSFDKAVPVFEKTYVSGNKVVTYGQSLDNMNSIGNNNLYKIEYVSDSIVMYSLSMGKTSANVAYKDSSYGLQGVSAADAYSCYVINPDNTLVLKQEKNVTSTGDEYVNVIPLRNLSLSDGKTLYEEGSDYIIDSDPIEGSIENFEKNSDMGLVYINKSNISTEYVESPFIFSKAADCTSMISKFNTLSSKAKIFETYSADLPSKAELEGYQKKIADWKQTVSE